MPKTQIEKDNPDVVLLPSGGLRLTLAIDKINVDYEGVKIEGGEATYEARRKARRDENDFIFDRHCARTAFTVPIALATGFGIGSVVTVTIEKPVSVGAVDPVGETVTSEPRA